VEIVELCQRGDRSVGQVARDFDLTETPVREWVKQGSAMPGPRAELHIMAGRLQASDMADISW
jgi:transposase